MSDEVNVRIRMGFKPNAKGAVPIDVTAEGPPDKVTDCLRQAITEFKQTVVYEGLQLVEYKT